MTGRQLIGVEPILQINWGRTAIFRISGRTEYLSTFDNRSRITFRYPEFSRRNAHFFSYFSFYYAAAPPCRVLTDVQSLIPFEKENAGHRLCGTHWWTIEFDTAHRLRICRGTTLDRLDSGPFYCDQARSRSGGEISTDCVCREHCCDSWSTHKRPERQLCRLEPGLVRYSGSRSEDTRHPAPGWLCNGLPKAYQFGPESYL